MIVWTMLPSVINGARSTTPFMEMFMLLFGETLACFMGFLVTAFFIFHIWLMLKAMTTIEFCEKKMPKGGKAAVEEAASVYDLGCIGNIRAVLGPDPLTWFLPIE